MNSRFGYHLLVAPSIWEFTWGLKGYSTQVHGLKFEWIGCNKWTINNDLAATTSVVPLTSL